MLEASSPSSASIPDSASHYHFKVEVDIRFEGGVLPEPRLLGG